MLTNGDISTGTGFFFNYENADFFITNKHVVEDAVTISIPVHRATQGRPQYVYLGEQKDYSINPIDLIGHADPDVDLCCVEANKIFNGVNKSDYFYLPIPAVAVVDDSKQLNRMPASIGVAMIGYPNGIWDKKNGLPIIRKGTTATHPAVPFNNRDEVVLDMACFPGSSGSPVMYYEPGYFASAQRFLGILYAGPTIDADGQILVTKIPTSTKNFVTVQTMMHLGYVITGKKIRDFIHSVEGGANKFIKQDAADAVPLI